MLAYVTWLASLRFPRAPLLFPPPNVPCVWAPGKGHNSGPVEKQTAEGPHPRPAETTVHISAQGTSDTLQTPVPPWPTSGSSAAQSEGAPSDVHVWHRWAKGGSRLSGPHPTSPLYPTQILPPIQRPYGLAQGQTHSGRTAGPPRT